MGHLASKFHFLPHRKKDISENIFAERQVLPIHCQTGLTQEQKTGSSPPRVKFEFKHTNSWESASESLNNS